jgi:hypothetical protein
MFIIMKFRFVFWDVLPYIIALMMEAARTSETSVDNYFTRQYIPEDKSELDTRRCENLKSHVFIIMFVILIDSDRMLWSSGFREVLGSNLGLEAGCPTVFCGVPQFLQEHSGIKS